MQLETSKPRLQLISNKTKKYVEGGAAHMLGKLISSGKNANNFVACRNERVLYWRSTDCKIYSFNFFCQQILLGLKNNVLNNWRVMVKIRPSTEEIEMHDLYSMDYGRMISRFRIIYAPKHNPNQNMYSFKMSEMLSFSVEKTTD